MKLIILPSALQDLMAGAEFYERQSAGLGGYFLESLSADIESLRLYAGIHLRVRNFHRALSKRFPFAIYYDQSAHDVRVWAVLDCRRNPIWIRRRLSRLGG